MNIEIFTQSYTEFFLKWMMLRELHRGVALLRVFCFGFLNFEWGIKNVEIFTQSYTEVFLKWMVLRELHRGGVALLRVSCF